MEHEESLLKPCKSLPPPFKDHDALQNRISPHPGSVSSMQGEMGQEVGNPAKETEGSYMAQEDGAVAQEYRMSRPHKGKEIESTATVRRKGPLQLLDLPLDILKDIFKEVSTCKGISNSIWADSTSRSHTRAICVVLPRRTLPYILSLHLSSTTDSI